MPSTAKPKLTAADRAAVKRARAHLIPDNAIDLHLGTLAALDRSLGQLIEAMECSFGTNRVIVANGPPFYMVMRRLDEIRFVFPHTIIHYEHKGQRNPRSTAVPDMLRGLWREGILHRFKTAGTQPTPESLTAALREFGGTIGVEGNRLRRKVSEWDRLDLGFGFGALLDFEGTAVFASSSDGVEYLRWKVSTRASAARLYRAAKAGKLDEISNARDLREWCVRNRVATELAAK